MTKDELQKIIEKNKAWMLGKAEGERADLRGAELCGADLRNADLRGADLRGADLRDVELCGADLRNADMCDVELRGADLRDVELCGADLRGADLRDVDLRDVDLRGADLRGADLRNADMCDVDLRGANLLNADMCDVDLRGANLLNVDLRGAINVPFIPMSCPDCGSFTAWKKAHGYIVKLLIPEDARRSSATGRKCRCDKAVVVAIETISGKLCELGEIASDYDNTVIYKVGETVTEPNFCEHRFIECAEGIHFFINRQEAVEYNR